MTMKWQWIIESAGPVNHGYDTVAQHYRTENLYVGQKTIVMYTKLVWWDSWTWWKESEI